MNPCLAYNPCLNNGICIREGSLGYSCLCSNSSFTGYKCEIKGDSVQKPNLNIPDQSNLFF